VLNNSNCNIRLNRVTLGIEQEITLHCQHHVFREVIVLARKDENGVDARDPNP
jgi:hypothetical protein